MKKLLLFMPLLILVLSACGTAAGSTNGGSSSAAPKDELSVSTNGLEKVEGFITNLADGRALVNDAFFSIDEKTHLVSVGDGEEKTFTFDDLDEGMRVDVYFSGVMAMSFPGQAYANIFVVKKDSDSLSQTEAFQAFLEEEDREQIVLLGQPTFSEDLISFNFTDMETGESFTVKLTISTKEYTITPME